MQTKHLTVLLTCHNRREKTLASINAVYQQTLPQQVQLNIYLVDDGSTDGTAEAIKELHPNVMVLHGDGNLFWNGGMRFAFAEASKADFDYYLWLNDDTVLYPRAITTLLDALHHLENQNNNPVIVVGSTQDPETDALTYGGLAQRNWWHPLRFDLLEPSPNLQPCDTLHGNCVLISRDVAKVVGNLDPAFKHNLGDYDYGLRARRKGCTIWMTSGYIGTCSPNPHHKRMKDLDEPLAKQWQKVSSPNPKGLAFQDVTLHTLEEWRVFAQRHGGLLWPVYWLIPYRRLVWHSLASRLIGS